MTQTTSRVSVDSGGAQGNAGSGDKQQAMSADGRYVVFESHASNLVPGDTNGAQDIFVRDRQAGTTERVNVATSGAQANQNSYYPSISADGRYVAFYSYANSLVPVALPASENIFVHDRQSGTTELVSVDSNGVPGNFDSSFPVISADGRYVAFESDATNLAPGDTNGFVDVFVHDRQSGTTERISVDSGGVQGNANSLLPSISGDGRYVAFDSNASNLVPGGTTTAPNVFVHDRQTGQTILASVDSNGMQGSGGSNSISGDGRYVAFISNASLVPQDGNGFLDVYVHDLLGGQTTRVSVGSSGAEANGASFQPSVSVDGHFVTFMSIAGNLVQGDTNGVYDVFIHDRQTSQTTRVSIDSTGAQADGGSEEPGVSADGRFVTFLSHADNLVPGDTNLVEDVFVFDRGALPSLAVFCFGDGSGASCPCGNTGLAGHGCDNSVSTGGALLDGSGQALLSNDSLLLTSTNERLTASSLFWQGDQEIAPRVFGDGVGCMGGHLKRLFFHNAVGGSVAAPQGTDLSVSSRSAAVGNPITPGTIRVYHVFYRDPDPNFCPAPAGATFNTTNGLRVLWGA